MADTVRIGILGDFTPEFRSHHATNDSLQHAAAKLKLKVESEWLPTPSLLEATAPKMLESFDGLWASPGSPYKSMDGMLKGIEFARRRDWPFLGTCGGFQYAVIECARNVLGMKDADSAENNSGSKNVIIYPVACAVPNRSPDALPTSAYRIMQQLPAICQNCGTHAIPAAFVFWLILRRSAILSPRRVGAAAGMLAGLASKTVLEVHCPNSNVWHVGFTVLGLVAALLITITGEIIRDRIS